MSLDRNQAAEALADIEATRNRGFKLYSYAKAAPFVFILGAMWFVADLLGQFSSLDQRYIWPVTGIVGGSAFVALGFLQNRRTTDRTRSYGNLWRINLMWFFVFLFVAATFRIFSPFNGYQTGSFIGLLFGTIYAVAGLWMGWRILAIGLALAVLSLCGYLYVHQYYAAYMGVVGGGGLMLSAFWLRKL